MVPLIFLLGLTATTRAFWDSAGNTCKSNEFACSSGHCVPSSSRCNGNNDCGDGSDEKSCEQILCKEPLYFRCNNKHCITSLFVCDGQDDCGDMSDELKCSNLDSEPVTCQKDEWQCSDKKLCIPTGWVCNGEPDCSDHSDEVLGCSSNIECDGFKCKNGHCVPKEWICDGNDDCNDKSDEMNCEVHFDIQRCNLDEKKFLCSDNTTCIDLHKTCDQHSDCPDNSDEGVMCHLKTNTCALHKCSHECIELPTGPRCICPIGYHNIDEKNCKDINECERYGICDQKCRNTPGSYECYCDSNFKLEPDRRSCKAEGGEALMVFSSKTDIRAYLLDSGLYYSVAKRLKQVVGVDYDGQHIYWTDIFAEHESIVRSLEDGSEREMLVTSGLDQPEDLAVDWLTGNFYFTDGEKHQIGVCTSTGEHCTALSNRDVRKPRGIVLNVARGDMYWTDWAEPAEIAYALMDGTKDRAFITENIHWPNGLALDYPNERLYWTDARKMSLESIRLDGTDRRTVLDGIVKKPYAIAVFGSNLYWSDWATHSIQSCDKFFGKNHHTIIKESKTYIYGLSIFHSAMHSRRINPCDRAFCSDICLLKGEDGYSCACPQNKILSLDGHVCREVEKKQMLIIGFKDTLLRVEHQLLGKHDVTLLFSMAKNIGCLAFDSKTNAILISDLETRQIISMNINTGLSKALDIQGLGRISDMDYDPMGNNLYLCDSEKAIVEVVNLNTLSRKILMHDMNGEIPEAIALVPEEGVMFVALKDPIRRASHIDRLSMDGSGRTHVIEDDLIGPMSLHYDTDVHRVFFADAGTSHIESTSVEGDDRHGFRILNTYPVGLTSLRYDLFWVNEHSKRLYWSEKNISTVYNRKITLDIPNDIEKLHLVSITPNKHYVSPCQTDNGGCSHLCLISHKSMVCACPVGWDLSPNNRTCVKREHCNSTEFLCHLSNTCILESQYCNGHTDCAFGEDEKDCKPVRKCPTNLFQCNNGDCIKSEKVCNHDYDCKDKSDEYNCEGRNKKSCPPLHIRCDDKCISQIFLCDGVVDCEDRSDEDHCSMNMCYANQFRCNSGACIPKAWECDRDYDCNDLSDEHADCVFVTCSPKMHTCSNGKCIDKKLVCDGIDDCGDNSDEKTCDILPGNCGIDEFACSSNASICLINSAKCNGTSECPHHEDEKDCSDCNIEEFNCDNKKCIPVQWICDGVDDCGDNTDEKTTLCSHTTDIMLGGVHTPCESGFRCKSGHCISFASVCNGKPDCYDGSDEGGLCSTACEGTHPCSHVCVATPTGPTCKCNPGYKLIGDGHSCEDLNECLVDPPLCSQLCNNNDGSYSCDCFNGFLLRSDKKTCKAEGPPMSLIFTSQNQIRRLTQRTNSLNIIYSEEMPKITGLDYAVQSDTVYFSIETTGTIHRINQRTQVREYIEHVGQPKKIAVDWATQNVYFFDAKTSSKSISVCNFEAMLCSNLIDTEIHRHVTALAVDSVNKVVFYSLVNWWIFSSPTYVIYKCNLDGSGREELVKFSSGYVTDITYDFNTKRLYYLDQHNQQISTVNYDGKMKSALFTLEVNSVSLKFFENHLFYLSNGGYMFKCKLFNTRNCDSFKLSSYTSELFTIIQDSLQPSLENVCKNHTCSYLCLPSESRYKCLCGNGKVIENTDKCPDILGISEDNDGKFQVHSVAVNQGLTVKRSNGVLLGIIIPLIIIFLIVTVILVLRKRNSGNFKISSIRFYNPSSAPRTITNEKSLLQPGQHEYINPVHFEDEQLEISPTVVAQKLNQLVDV